MNNHLLSIKLLLIVTSFFGPSQVFGQQKTNSLSSQLNQDTNRYKPKPKLILYRPFKGVLETTNLVIDMLDVDSTESTEINSPGIPAPDSLSITITYCLINNAPLLNYNELMKTYSIPSEDQNLPVFIDSLLAYKPKQTYYELGDVLSVRVATENSTGMRYISVITLFPAPKRHDAF
jgi:hypothetical protein